jgi:exo-beta-1,3-glucanase (GH17 family)
MSLAGVDVSGLSREELRSIVRKILEAKIHGISFSPYVEGQGPGTELGEAQIVERLQVIAPYVRWVRSFSCTEGHELIPRLARERGLKTMVGVWLDDDLEHNEEKLASAIEVSMSGHADILAVAMKCSCAATCPRTNYWNTSVVLSRPFRTPRSGTSTPIFNLSITDG